MCTRQGGRGGGGEGSRGFTGEVGFQARACGTAELTEYWLTGPGCGWRSSSARSHSCKASGLPVTRLGPVTTARGWSRVVASWVTSPLWWTAHLIEAHYTRVGEGSPGEGMRLKRQILLRGKSRYSLISVLRLYNFLLFQGHFSMLPNTEPPSE